MNRFTKDICCFQPFDEGESEIILPSFFTRREIFIHLSIQQIHIKYQSCVQYYFLGTWKAEVGKKMESLLFGVYTVEG